MTPLLLLMLFTGIAASLCGGMVGSLVVVQRIVLLSGSISHAVLGGMGLALFLQRVLGFSFITPLMGALASALFCAFVLSRSSIRSREREDTAIAIIWSTGMALGILLLSLTPGYNVEVMHLLLGNIAWVSQKELLLLAGWDLFLLASLALFFRQIQAVCFDKTHAKLKGLPVEKIYFGILAAVAITVVLLIQVVGALLVITLLAIPPAIAARFTSRLAPMMIAATLFSLTAHLLGVGAAYLGNWPPGATIALAAALLYYTIRPLHSRQTSGTTLPKRVEANSVT